MKLLKGAVLQALILTVAAFVVAFAHNSFNRNGINPMRRVAAVPVVHDSVMAALHAQAIRIIDLAEARSFVESGGRVIDARTKEAYDDGHIPGALLLDYYQLGTYCDKVLPLLSPDEYIVVYCSEQSCEDSELLAKELYTFGFRKLLIFKGGFAEWSRAGLPVEKSR